MDIRSTTTPLLDALARGTAAGASAAAKRDAAEAAACLDSAALAADARVVPALAAAACSRHADGAVVEPAMASADPGLTGSVCAVWAAVGAPVSFAALWPLWWWSKGDFVTARTLQLRQRQRRRRAPAFPARARGAEQPKGLPGARERLTRRPH
jgi:hypothetical protein